MWNIAAFTGVSGCFARIFYVFKVMNMNVLDFETKCKVKENLNSHRQNMPSLIRLVNTGDKEEIKKEIEFHYSHLREIYKLCNL